MAERDTSQSVGRLLTIGTMVSVGLTAVGVALMLLGGHTPVTQAAPAFDPGRALSGLVGRDASTWLWLGLIVAVALPSGRVALALAGFVHEGNRRQAGIALGILAVLAVSLAVAAATR